MLKKTVTICFILFSMLPVTAQTISGNFSFAAPKYKSKTLDNSQLEVYYNYVHLKDAANPNSQEESIASLQIGADWIKFSDYHRFKFDSLQKQMSQLKVVRATDLNKLMPIFKQLKFSATIFINPKQNKVIVYDKIYSNRYSYTTSQPKLKWTISQTTKTLLGHQVVKATTHYAGRDWIAWFTPEIALPYGPYIFGGLPGLILELHDTENNFHFTATALEQHKTSIYRRIEDDIVEISKQKFFKFQRAYHSNPEQFGSKLSGKLPYNPIELSL